MLQYLSNISKEAPITRLPVVLDCLPLKNCYMEVKERLRAEVGVHLKVRVLAEGVIYELNVH